MTKATYPEKNRPLIVFGEDWGAHPSSTQHIVEVLAKTRTVIWVNSIGLRKPKFSFHDLARLFNKVRFSLVNQQQNNIVKVESSRNFTIINPLVIPCANSWLSLKISKVILTWQFKIACQNIKFTKPIIWASLPTTVDYLDIFEDADCVYYCGDDFNSLAGVDHEFVSLKEVELIKRSNYIFTASEKLLAKFPSEKTIHIPHGVNFLLFSKPVNTIPRDLPQGKPVAGFYGSISTWLDQDLLVESITALPHWHFVFIGKVCCNVDKLKQFDNVSFLGEKPHQELPQHIQHWNVALLPFIDNEQIKMCNPLKLREYLASGTPIATTNFNALNGYRKYLQISSLVKPFYQAILLANAEVSPVVNFDKLTKMCDLMAITRVKALRQECVINESWEQRAIDVQRYLMRC